MDFCEEKWNGSRYYCNRGLMAWLATPSRAAPLAISPGNPVFRRTGGMDGWAVRWDEFNLQTKTKRISDKLKIPEELVKKRFYRAYEITQGKKYDIEKNHELWEIRKTELEKGMRHL
jgi:hypothetical protein